MWDTGWNATLDERGAVELLPFALLLFYIALSRIDAVGASGQFLPPSAVMNTSVEDGCAWGGGLIWAYWRRSCLMIKIFSARSETDASATLNCYPPGFFIRRCPSHTTVKEELTIGRLLAVTDLVNAVEILSLRPTRRVAPTSTVPVSVHAKRGTALSAGYVSLDIRIDLQCTRILKLYSKPVSAWRNSLLADLHRSRLSGDAVVW
ncbi:hypothetical protein C8Q77DRAFT_708426 [Trametes polyzona]|nr:hypothetical protein C8Q77DRAFT_708426 [Trametes polyzona]